MKIVYSSGLGCPKTIDDKLVLEQVDNSTDFVDNIKRNLKGVKKMVFISNRWDRITSLAQPGDEVFNDFHYTNEEYAKAVRTCFAKAKLVFNEMVIVDGEYKGNLKKELKDADFIYIQGGHTTRGLKVLEDLKFKNALEEFDGMILVTGTAAKLLSTKILATQNLVDYDIEKGLGLKDYSVRPFFKHTLKYKFKKSHRARVKLLKNFSKEVDVYAIGYLSYIIDLGHELQFYGPCYLFKNGKLRKVKKTSTR
jgi:peptidase E